MIEDEIELEGWIHNEASIRREICAALAAGTALHDCDYSNYDPRVHNAYNRGWNIALATLKAQKVSMDAYRMSWTKAGSNNYDAMSLRAFYSAREAFVDEATAHARTTYHNNRSIKFWREEGPFVAQYRAEAAQAFATLDNHLADLTLPG